MKLSTDPIEMIKEAEASAERIIADAKNKAREIKLLSEKRTIDNKEKAVLCAKDEALKEIENGNTLGDNIANQILADANKTCEEITQTAEKNMDKAVKFICERVVKAKCQ